MNAPGAKGLPPSFPGKTNAQTIVKKHVMLSFDHDGDLQVVDRIIHALEVFAMPIWINTKRKLNEALVKHSIEGSWCFVAFISPHFQESAECKFEVMYALQHNVPIIPVKIEGHGWQPTGWLADATTGVLWVDATEDNPQDINVKAHSITIAVKKVTGFEFSGGLTPRPGDAPIMIPPKRALTPSQREVFDSLNKLSKGLNGWVSSVDLGTWAAAQNPPITVDKEKLAHVERDLYNSYHTKQAIIALTPK